MANTMELFLVLNPDVPDRVVVAVIKGFRVFEVELDDRKFSAVMMGYEKPDAPVARDGHDLLAASQILALARESLIECQIESPVVGLLIHEGLSELAYEYLSKTFYVVEVEIEARMRKVLRAVWKEVEPDDT